MRPALRMHSTRVKKKMVTSKPTRIETTAPLAVTTLGVCTVAFVAFDNPPRVPFIIAAGADNELLVSEGCMGASAFDVAASPIDDEVAVGICADGISAGVFNTFWAWIGSAASVVEVSTGSAFVSLGEGGKALSGV